MIDPDIKKLLQEKQRARIRKSITINSDHEKELTHLAEKHGLTLSSMIEICIEKGLADPYINPLTEEDN